MDEDRTDGLASGRTLGTYRIERLLGRGGMGRVYLAYDTRLHRQAALKLIEGVDRDAARSRLLSEARSAAALSHPNICTIHEVGEADGTAFIAMEYVRGRSLRERVDEGALPVGDVVHLAIQAADALGYAHEHGVVHRDFKAANAIVGDEGRLKVVDFGLARRDDPQLAEATTMASVGPAGTVAGTPYSMAPEQVRGEAADARTDVWALGVLLHEMLSAGKPFGGERPIPELFSSILRDAPAPLPVEVPRALRAVVERCLEKDPARRWQTAGEVLAALKEISHSSTTSGPRRTSLIRSSVAAGLVILVSIVVINRDSLIRTARAPEAIDSLAILPLEDLAQEPGGTYFADGMLEELITKMARVEGLRVVPRSAVTQYRGTRRPLEEVARELSVDSILEGSILRSGEQVRITAHLIDPHTNRELWAESYERSLSDVLALQSEVAVAIANALRLRLTSNTEAVLAAPSRHVNPTAYDLYLRGLTRIEQVNRADAEAAVAELEKAVALEPGFADAWGTLASAYAQLYGSFDPQQASLLEPKVRTAIDNALSLDADSPNALLAQAILVWNRAHGWRHEEAIEAARKAIAAKPNFSHAHLRLSTYFNHVGFADAALRTLAELDENPAVLFQKGLAFHTQGRQDLALTSWLAIPAASRNTNHAGHIAWALANVGRSEEAFALLEGVSPSATDVNGMLSAARALLHAIAGEHRQAEEFIGRATARAVDTQESHHATYIVASAYARMGMLPESLRWLRFTAANGYPSYPLFASDRNLDALRSYEPFVTFLEESKARWKGYQARLGL
ncbi:MAG TPA: protein kinase [Vicinamibacterales bacterium]|jgi:non-specific serine/threonine protein kinase|nr:protein kinase [Vicinamibacterales bacterium]